MEHNKTFVYREQGKKWELPTFLTFYDPAFVKWAGQKNGVKYGDHVRSWKYRMLGFREPKKGEWYLSGAKVTAWYAPNDLSTKFLVVEPTERYKVKTVSMFERM